jgi:hypothetical protein
VQVYNKKLDLFFSLPLVSLLQTCSAAVDIGIRQSNPIAKGGRKRSLLRSLSRPHLYRLLFFLSFILLRVHRLIIGASLLCYG